MKIKLTDFEGDQLKINDSDDYLCYLSINGDSMFGVSPLHANKIIETLTELLKLNK